MHSNAPECHFKMKELKTFLRTAQHMGQFVRLTHVRRWWLKKGHHSFRQQSSLSHWKSWLRYHCYLLTSELNCHISSSHISDLHLFQHYEPFLCYKPERLVMLKRVHINSSTCVCSVCRVAANARPRHLAQISGRCFKSYHCPRCTACRVDTYQMTVSPGLGHLSTCMLIGSYVQ